MVPAVIKPITLAEFLAQPETKPASEFIDGKIVQKPMPQGQHSRIQQKLIATINLVLEDSKIALALPELRCTFGGRSTVPDVVVFMWEHIPTYQDGTIADRVLIAPDWAIEVLSPEQSSSHVTRNILHCLNHGTQMGWLIDPSEKLIFTHGFQQPMCCFEDATDLLPVPDFAAGLQLSLGQVFAWLQIGVAGS